MLALGVIAARTLARLAATLLLSWPSGLGLRQAAALGLALSPASGVTLLLAADLFTASPGLAAQIGAVAFSAIAILELLGPLAVYWALDRSGETHA